MTIVPLSSQAINPPSCSDCVHQLAEQANAFTDPFLEADGFRRWQRALRQPRAWLAHVVFARCDIVRTAGIEERGEHLDVPAPDTELELAATVHLDPACRAVLDALQQPLRGAEAGRLDVQPARLHRQSADVRNGVDRRIEAQPPLL